MIRLKEIDCLENYVGTYDGRLASIYIGLVEKIINGHKGSKGIILAGDAGHPKHEHNVLLRNPVLIQGDGICMAIAKIKLGTWPFKLLDYDERNFPNCFLTELIPTVKIKQKHIGPKIVFDFEYEPHIFDYNRTLQIEEDKSEFKKTKRIIYDNFEAFKFHKHNEHYVVPSSNLLPAKIEIKKPIIKPFVQPPPEKSNLKFISYE